MPKQTNTLNCEKVVWEEISSTVKSINPELHNIIEKINPSPNYPVYKVRYPYGSIILNRGVFRLPLRSGGLVKLDDPVVPEEIKNDLCYAGTRTPAGFVINRSLELFVDTEQQLLPWHLIKEGKFFASFSSLEASPLHYPAKIFSITAGARNVFMLPNIGDKFLHQNLKKNLRVRASPPKALTDHWMVFREIAQSEKKILCLGSRSYSFH